MINKDQLPGMLDFLYGTGVPVPGCELSMAEAVAEVSQHYPGKPYCLVRSWTVVDLLDSQGQLLTDSEGEALRVLFAHEVVFDSAGRFAPGWWVRSNYACSWKNDEFFETRRTVYVLLGDGFQKSVDERLVFSVHN